MNEDNKFLGELCPHGHDYNNSGKSLRYICGTKRCVKCALDRHAAYISIPKNRAHKREHALIRRRGQNPNYTTMYENKSCAGYLGIVIAEGVLNKVFDGLIKMDNGNKGYDFICGKGHKLDVKSSCISSRNRWSFRINENDVADYFILMGFDNRNDLNPLYVWIIHKNEIIRNRKMKSYGTLIITNSPSPLSIFSEYECNDTLHKVVEYCSIVSESV